MSFVQTAREGVFRLRDRVAGASRLRVQPPYAGAALPSWWRYTPWLLIPAFSLFCFLYGSFFALTAPFLIVQMAFPLAVLMLIVIWALPDSPYAPTRLLEAFFFAFFIGLVMWPNYLAFSPPGMPWITMVRLTGFPAVLLLLICASTSRDLRRQVGQALNTVPTLWKFLVIFAVVQVLTVPLSDSVVDTMNKVVGAQVSWTAMFFIGVFVFLKPDRPARWAGLIWAMSLVIGAIGFWENTEGKVLWAEHIPSFLKIEDEVVGRILAGQQRAAIGVHRVQSTFSTSLGLAEYLALTIPFVLHFAFGRFRLLTRIAAGATVPFLLYIVLVTDSRLGMVGFLLGSLAYVFFWAALRWRESRNSLFGPAITLAYPTIFCAAIASTFFVGRIRNAVWGNGAERASNEGRISQYQDAIPLILKEPWGHGMGQGALALGHRNPEGLLTIDTYYMAIGLDYGILGMISFYGALILAIFVCVRQILTSLPRDRDTAILMPLTVALMNFLVIKSVFSQQDNHALVFMMLGMAVALVHRATRPGEPAVEPRPVREAAGPALAYAGAPRVPRRPAIQPDRP